MSNFYSRLDEALETSLSGPNMQSASAAPEDNEILDAGDLEMDQEIEGLDSDDEQQMALKTDLQAQQKAEEAAMQQQEKILKPQLDDLTQQVGGIDQNMINGMDQLQGGTAAMGQLDQQMAGIRKLLQTLQGSI